MRTKKQQLATAYHEAGHAVVRYFLEIGFKNISIIPNETEGSLGHTNLIIPDSFDPTEVDLYKRISHRANKEIMSRYGGEASEFILTSRHNWEGAADDTNGIFEIAWRLYGDSKQISKQLENLQQRTLTFLKQPSHWVAVRKLAEELLNRQRLSAKEAKRIISEASPLKTK